MVKLVLTVKENEKPTEQSIGSACPVSVNLNVEEGKENGNEATPLEMLVLLGIRKNVEKVLTSEGSVQKLVDGEQRELIKHLSKYTNKNGEIKKDEPDVIVRV